MVANSFDAHRLSHLAKKYSKQNELEEALFKAYFTDGKNTADHSFLLEIALEIGIKKEEIIDVLNSNIYEKDVKDDILQAQQLGVSGVPFFVLDRKYAISGAQESDTFLEALTKAYEEHLPSSALQTIVKNGENCGPNECDL